MTSYKPTRAFVASAGLLQGFSPGPMFSGTNVQFGMVYVRPLGFAAHEDKNPKAEPQILPQLQKCP